MTNVEAFEMVAEYFMNDSSAVELDELDSAERVAVDALALAGIVEIVDGFAMLPGDSEEDRAARLESALS